MILGISLDSPETVLKYIGGIHSYLKHTILMFNPTSIDEVSVQATHIEGRCKNVNPKVGGSSKPIARKSKENRKENGNRGRQMLYKRPSLHALTTRRMDMMMNTF